MRAHSDNRSRSVERACEVLALVGAARYGMTIDQLAEALGMPAATVRRLTSALLAKGYLRRWDIGLGRYGLGPAVVDRARELAGQVDARRREGWSAAVIAQTLRVPVEWLRGVLTSGGVS